MFLIFAKTPQLIHKQKKCLIFMFALISCYSLWITLSRYYIVWLKNKHTVMFFYWRSWLGSDIFASNIMHFPLNVPYEWAPEYINNIRCADKCSYIYSKWVRPVEWFLNRQLRAPQRAEDTVWMEITAQEPNLSSVSIQESTWAKHTR